ncbi:MAG: FAD binding domain-containing protein [Ignavibacteriaceae bacterium]
MKTKINFICNSEKVSAEVHPGFSLLDFLRKNLALTGTKEGCREGDCGACTVLIGELNGKEINYYSVNSCLFPVGDVNRKHVVTVEGLRREELTVVQKSFVEEGASQCGFCTPGFIVSLTGYFLSNKSFNPNGAIDSMDGNICRCTGHSSIIRAAQKSAEIISSNITNHTDHLNALIKSGLIPDYFSKIPNRLKQLKQEKLSKEEKIVPNFYISGGTDLFVQKWEDILKNDVKLLSSNGITSAIIEESGKCIVGAAATVSDLINSDIISKHLPHLKVQLKLFGSLPIRNNATVGGNIVNASPIADITSILLALNAVVHLKKESSERKLFLKDFYKGYKSLNLNNGELVDYVSFDYPAENSYFNFEKVSQRTYLDIASANSSIYLEYKNNSIITARLSAGGVAPIPLFLKKTSDFLNGKTINADIVKEAAAVSQAEISPITDARGSAEYKALLLSQLIIAHFITSFPDKVKMKEIA